MTLSGEDVVQYTQEVAEDLVPVFAEEYGIDLVVPDIKETRAGYAPVSAQMQYIHPSDTQDIGVIKVRGDRDWDIPTVVGVTAHELGHAGLYQHSTFQDLWENDDYEPYLLRSISEGVAQHAEQAVLRKYASHDIEDSVHPVRYQFKLWENNAANTFCRITQGALEHVSGTQWKSTYTTGREIFANSTSDDVAAAMTDPEALYDQLKTV